MEALDKDLIKILEYEFDYVRQRHIKLLALTRDLLEEAERVEEDLKALGFTLGGICKGEREPFKTPVHPRFTMHIAGGYYAKGS